MSASGYIKHTNATQFLLSAHVTCSNDNIDTINVMLKAFFDDSMESIQKQLTDIKILFYDHILVQVA